MIKTLKGWKGIAAGAVFIVLSIAYNSAFKAQISESVLLQIPGYFLIGLGCALVLYAALASSDTENKKVKPSQDTASDADDAPSEEESK